MEIWRMYAFMLNNVIMAIVPYLYDQTDKVEEDAKEMYGDDATISEVTHIPVRLADEWDEGKELFYRYEEGEKKLVIPVPSYEGRLMMLEEDNTALNSAVDDLAVAILEG